MKSNENSFYLKTTKTPNKIKAIHLIIILIISNISTINSLKNTNKIIEELLHKDILNQNTPNEIENYTVSSEENRLNKINIDLDNKNPLDTLKMKQEIEELYKDKIGKKVFNAYKKNTNFNNYSNNNNFTNKLNSRLNKQSYNHNKPNYRFKSSLMSKSSLTKQNEFSEQHYNKDDVNQNIETPIKDSDILTTKPTLIGKIGAAMQKEHLAEEEQIPIYYSTASSTYISSDDEQNKQYFEAKNILKEDKFWCSSGGHLLEETVHFTIEFPKSYRLSSIWIHWAFAPGKFMIQTSNKKIGDEIIIDDSETPLIPWRFSIKHKDINFWKSVLSNPATRWNYKSFDERIELPKKRWAKYIVISMSIPVNQYFGIYKIEFYTKSRTVVQIKSKMFGEDLCLSAANGTINDGTRIVALNCIQGISYADNRDMFVIHSNGFITTYKNNKCLESADILKIGVLDCGKASDFKDNREKWILDYDGKIRSQKEEFTCLSITDSSVKDYVNVEDIKASASSTYEDGIHEAKNVFMYYDNAFWISGLGKTPVTFEIYFFKNPYTVKSIEIVWKFPAQYFQVSGLLSDGYWRSFLREKNNRKTTTIVNTMNRDLLGIKIIMKKSTTKTADNYVYGISNIFVLTGARYLRREACKDVMLNANLFEIVDVLTINDVVGNESQKTNNDLHQSLSKLKNVQENYQQVPPLLTYLKEKNYLIQEDLSQLLNDFESIHMKVLQFNYLQDDDSLNVFNIATSEFYPAQDCYHIIKSYPNKRSGFYWVKNECMSKPLKVYCDFDSYNNNAGLDYYIFNENQMVNSIMRDIQTQKDLYTKCASLGLEPINIKNIKMMSIIHSLLNILGYNLNTDNVVPIAYDFSCDSAKCSKMFQPFTSEKLNDINDILEAFQRQQGEGINFIFSSSTSNNNDGLVTNTSAIGKIDNIVRVNLASSQISAVICSSNNDGLKSVKNYIDMACDQNLREDTFREYQIFTSIKILCPPNCSKTKAKIYGNTIYTDNSSACVAAIHQGIINDTQGGIAEIRFENGRKNYPAAQGHGIESFEYPDEWDRSFSVRKYDPYCPLDKVKDFNKVKISQMISSSFLEINNSNSIDKGLNDINQNDIEKSINILKQANKQDRTLNLNSPEMNNIAMLLNNLANNNNNSNNIEKSNTPNITNNTALSKSNIMSFKEKLLKATPVNNPQIQNNSINGASNNNNNKINDINNLKNDQTLQQINKSNPPTDSTISEIQSKISSVNKETKSKLINELNKSLDSFKLLLDQNIYKDLPFDQRKVFDEFAKTVNFIQSGSNSSAKITSLDSLTNSLNNQLQTNVKNQIENSFNASIQSKNSLYNTIKNSISNSHSIGLNELLNNGSSTSSSNTSSNTITNKLNNNTGPSNVSNKNYDNQNDNTLSGSSSTDNYLNQISRDNLVNTYSNDNQTIPNIRNADQTNALSLARLMKDIRQQQKQTQLKNDENLMRNFLGFKVPESHMTTEIAKLYIDALVDKEKLLLEEVQNLAESFKKIVGQAVYTLDVIMNDKVKGLKNAEHVYQEINNKKDKISLMLYDLDNKSTNKVSKISHTISNSQEKIKNYYTREPYNEDYSSNDIFEKYEAFTSKKGKGKAPIWEYFMYNLDGHLKVISQKGNFVDNRSGSHLVIKDRDYFDFELKFSVLLKGNKTFGVAFRRINDFSYYIFQISNEEKGYKRVMKFKNGYPTKIVDKYDGGFVENTWYYVKIRAQQANFKIYMTTNSENLDKMYDLIFEFEDNEHVHGTISYASQGIDWLLIDNISIVPLACTNFDKPRTDKVVIITPTCSRFYENFKNNYKQRWTVVDPKESVEGPSTWMHNPLEEELSGNEIHLNPINYGSKAIILQNSKIYGTNNFQEGTKFILTDSAKSCSRGKISVKIKVLDEIGIVGVVFRVEDLNRYYLLEISSSFVRIRKKIEDNYSLLTTNETMGFQLNIPLLVVLTLDNDKMNCFITKNGQFDNLIKVFDKDLIDSDLKHGTIGLSTYKTRAYFEDIFTEPLNLDNEFENNIFVDEMEDPILSKLPKIKDTQNILDKVNNGIGINTGNSWDVCLRYPQISDRKKYCSMNFSGGTQKKSCLTNFCPICCEKVVDKTNKSHVFLCEKQCSIMLRGDDYNHDWKTCIEPNHPKNSVYNYCDKEFSDDFYKNSRCKTDMCNLCCVNYENKNKTIMTNNNIQNCYNQCLTTFNKISFN